jgi:outer membrane protein OmpU
VSDSSAAGATDTAYGLGVSYDLGGASVLAGVQKDTTGETQADLGVSFSF